MDQKRRFDPQPATSGLPPTPDMSPCRQTVARHRASGDGRTEVGKHVESVVHGINGVRSVHTDWFDSRTAACVVLLTAERRTNMGHLGRGALRAFPAPSR